MEDERGCERCGSTDHFALVEWGCYAGACAGCQLVGPVTSFIAVAPDLPGNWRATLLDDDWREVEVIAQGSGAPFTNKVRAVAGTGKKVRLDWLGD